MNAVTLGADNRIARISGGARASDLLAVTDRLGLAAVTGSCGAVGMTGLTLGGGYGALIGRYGLTLDNLIAAEIVLADGHIVTAKRDCEEELFWALRGGGGNFGVVTSMQYRLHDLPSIRSGMLLFPFTEARAVLEGCADIAASAPDVVDIRISWLETTRTVWRKATVATSNGSSRQSGTTIPIASSPPFRCRQLSTGWPPNSPRAVEGNGCESPPFVTCPQIAKGP
jgi:FAD/FMN-containing dehydrogenase